MFWIFRCLILLRNFSLVYVECRSVWLVAHNKEIKVGQQQAYTNIFVHQNLINSYVWFKKKQDSGSNELHSKNPYHQYYLHMCQHDHVLPFVLM